MSEKVAEGQKQWGAFLERWPVSKLRDLTLEEYYDPDAGDSFFSWLTTHTEQLGRFREGPMSAGVRPCGPNAQSDPGAGIQSDQRYIWYSILGDSAQEAFVNLKNELLTAVDAVRSGDLGSMSLLVKAPGSLVWKVAFLYQDQSQPLVLPFYRARQLRAVAGGRFKGKEVELQQQLMALRGGKGLLAFAEELESQAPSVGTPLLADEVGVTAPPLNQILFGPPGTGKTYTTIDAALEILDPEFLAANREDRVALKERFDELAAAGQVRFVTFHQSFSYEDFVQGIRAETVSGQLQYSVHDGVFKQLCDRARSGVAEENDVFDQALARFKQAIAEADENGLLLQTITGKTFRVEHSSGSSVLAFPASAVDQKHDYFVLLKDVRRLYEGVDKKSITNNSSYVWGVLEFLRKKCGLPPYQAPDVSKRAADGFVLIIDEINRGNVSRIFGELITLIESSKREGAEEALAVSLPYGSEDESFSVPSNLYLIGTMNTADRSLAGLDIALRRRFTFREMPPRPDLLDEVVVAGINIGQLLRTLNERIEVLLDRDHCLGHAYFMPLKDDPRLERLEAIFRNQVLPLLQEYFFEDWQRIQWVLNDHRKAAMDRFVYQSKRDLRALFGEEAEVSAHNLPWSINAAAFQRIAAYAGIIAVPAKVAAPLGVSEAAEA